MQGDPPGSRIHRLNFGRELRRGPGWVYPPWLYGSRAGRSDRCRWLLARTSSSVPSRPNPSAKQRLVGLGRRGRRAGLGRVDVREGVGDRLRRLPGSLSGVHQSVDGRPKLVS